MIRIFRHYISGNYLGLTLLEATLFFWALYCAKMIRYQAFFINYNLVIASLIYAFVMLVSVTGMGLYQRTQGAGGREFLFRLVGSFILGSLGMTAILYLVRGIVIERTVFLMAAIISFVGMYMIRHVFYKLVDQQLLKRRVLVVGAGARASKILNVENREGYANVQIIGYARNHQERLQVPPGRVIEIPGTLSQYTLEQNIDEIVIAPDERRKGLPVKALLDCKMKGIDVIDLSTFFEREGGVVRVDTLNPSWLLFSDGFQVGFSKDVIKRLFDIAASLLSLGVIWPVMMVTALVIWIESYGRGPVLYTQVRVGANWRLFKVIKFRSMHIDAEEGGKALMAEKGDRRVTRVGYWLRRCRIDELPQLFNVLKGEMSFVGPRPERPEFVEKFAETIPYYSERHRVKPGITGWAQLCYPYGTSEQDALEKLQYDLYYVKNYSIFLDFIVMLQTIEVVLWGKGAH